MRNQKLGNLGEDAFRTWCHQQNLTVHKSDGSEDRTGWDFMVEFPQQEYDRPRDEWLAPIECRVQVKSTDKQNKTKRIEVSNLERLAKAPIPTFFCFIEFDGHDTPQAAYLVHVGEDFIAKTLKKIRKLESQKKHNSLNKHKMSVRYTDSDSLPDTTGEALKAAIEKYVPHGIGIYGQEKKEFLRNVGFEDGVGVINITFAGQDPLTDLVDWTIGIQKKLYVDKFVGFDQRFGILLENSKLSGESGVLSLCPTPIKVFLIFKEDEKSRYGISFESDLYLPLIGLISQEYIKFRIKSDFFEWTVKPYTIGEDLFRFGFTGNIEYSLEQLRKCCKFMKILNTQPDFLIVEIKKQLDPKQKVVFPVKVNFENEIDSSSDIIKIVDRAANVCHAFDIPEHDFLVSIDDLLQAIDELKYFDYLCNGNKSGSDLGKIHFKKKNLDLDEKKIKIEQKVAINLFSSFFVGKYRISFYLIFFGFWQEPDETSYTVNVYKCKIGKRLVTFKGDFLDRSAIDRELQVLDRTLEDRGFLTITVFPDGNDLIFEKPQ